MSYVAAIALLVSMGTLGMALLRRYISSLDLLEQLAYGLPLGVVLASLMLFLLTIPFGLNSALVIILGIGCAVGALGLWPRKSRPDRHQDAAQPERTIRAGLRRGPRPGNKRRKRRVQPGKPVAGGSQPASRAATSLGPFAALAHLARDRKNLLAALVLGLFALRWVILWHSALTYRADGLWAGQINIWGDWTQHLGDVSTFAYGGNLPPDHPRFAHHPYAYHYLAALTAAAMVTLGLDPAAALTFHSLIFSLVIALGVYTFARRLTGDRQVAALTIILVFLGGGFSWLISLSRAAATPNPLLALLRYPWDQQGQDLANFRWQNLYFVLIEPQRGYLYGLPLGLLIFTLLLLAAQAGKPRLFASAGIVAGLLPLAHLSTLLALALITPFLFFLFPSRWWALFFGVWIALAVPQLYLQQGGDRGATAAMRLQLGWVAGPDAWPWFWLKNLGLFLPLLGIALTSRPLLPALSRRFLWGFMPLFLIANVAVFQPWDWDNIKVLAYWFLAVCVAVAALLTRWWRTQRTFAVRSLIAAAVVTMTLSGLLLNLSQLLGQDQHLLLTREEVDLAATVRTITPPAAIFAAGLQHNHPISVLAGRRVMMGYPGVLWAQGIDYAQRERDLRAIYALASDMPALVSRYDVTYVVIGPNEQQQLGANLAGYRARYPLVLHTANYEIFKVR